MGPKRLPSRSPAPAGESLHMGFPGARPLVDRGVVGAGIGIARGARATLGHHAGRHVIIYTMAGLGSARYGRKELRLRRGALWVLPSHPDRRLAAGRGSGWHFLWFALEDGERWQHLRRHGPREIFAGQAGRMVECLRGLIGESSGAYPDRGEMGGHFASALALFLQRRLGVFPAGAERVAAFERLWQAVQADLPRNWAAADMANHVHLSVPHFHRLCRELYGETPRGCLRRLRMEEARDRILEGKLTLDAVAESVGYGNGLALSKAFRQHFGSSPRPFRQSYRASSQPPSSPAPDPRTGRKPLAPTG